MGENKPHWSSRLPVLGSIWLTGAVVDRLWFAIDRSVPGWDQADYLTGAMNYWRAFQQPQWFSQDWWTQLWMLSSKLPPFVYISTTPFISLLGAGIEQSTLVNLLYSAILLGSVYGLGVRLFTAEVGLWAAGLCLLLPGLYKIRLDYLIDYPLVAMVTLSFWLLTLLATNPTRDTDDRITTQEPQPQDSLPLKNLAFRALVRFLWAPMGFGLAFGLALLTKQPALFFLFTPIAWLVLRFSHQMMWRQLSQLLIGLGIAVAVCFPWYRTNWLLILTAGKRATVDSAVVEGDPALNTLAAWTFYLQQLPRLVSLPILLIGLVGLGLYWKRSIISRHWTVINGQALAIVDYGGLRAKGYRRTAYRAWWQSVRWLLIFLLGAYLLCSLNINKDDRYLTPLLPVFTVLLAQGLVLFPDQIRGYRWGAVGLASFFMLINLLPANAIPIRSQHPTVLTGDWHHAEVVDEVIRSQPYLRSTIGVLPSTVEFNQHNLNYFGVLRNFQVYGRQVGTQLSQVKQELRSLSWFVTKSGDQGSIRKREAQTALSETIARSPELQLQKSWTLPDQSLLKLYRRRVPVVQVQPSTRSPERVQLEQIRVPNQAAPGKPMPVTYRWSGSWEQLKSGLVLLTWKQTGGSANWLHDHAIGLGALHPDSAEDKAAFQVIERLAMLPPTQEGTYTLEATYLNRNTGETYAIPVPDVQVRITPSAAAIAVTELDGVTQLRSLALELPKGLAALSPVFEQIGRLNQFDAVQDYVVQANQALTYRLRQNPQNLEFTYALALANVLQRNVQGAIAAFEKVTQLDAKNPSAFAYLAFVNLYDLRPQAAQAALQTAIAIDPSLPELHALNGVAALMQGRFRQAWQELQISQSRSS